eukprot:2250165-Prymnesium_polylepis.2
MARLSPNMAGDRGGAGGGGRHAPLAALGRLCRDCRAGRRRPRRYLFGHECPQHQAAQDPTAVLRANRWLDGLMAIRDCFEDTRALLEPAGAISIAGLCKWKKASAAPLDTSSFGGSYVAIASDACNIEFDFLKEFASEATSGATFVRIGDRPMGTRPT